MAILASRAAFTGVMVADQKHSFGFFVVAVWKLIP
jgi:hypothetical protein